MRLFWSCVRIFLFVGVGTFFITYFVLDSRDKLVDDSVPEPEKEDIEVNAVLLKDSLWAIDEENMAYLTDAVQRDDIEYIDQLNIEKKVFATDRDTKVVRIGEVTPEGTVAIRFKEGRYTNKLGKAYVFNVISEEEYPAYLEEKKHEPKELIKNGLASTDNFFELMKAENFKTENIDSKNIEALIQMRDLCNALASEMKEKSEDSQVDADTRECMQKAREIILRRGAAIVACLNFIDQLQQYKQKAAQGKLSAQENANFKKQYPLTVQSTFDLCKDAEKLRYAFKNKYGF